MWLNVPNMPREPASPSAEASSGSIAEFGWFCPIFVLWVLSSGKPTRQPSSSLEWAKAPWIRLLYGTISRPSTAERTAAEWISLLPASPARATALPAADSVSTTSDGCGPSAGASCSKPAPDGCSSRTSPDCSPPPGTRSAKSSTRWPRAGGLRSGITFQRQPSAPRTSAIVSSCSLPTPTASEYGSSQNGINGIGGQNERPSAARPSLGSAARSGTLIVPAASDAAPPMIPTPLASSGRQRGGRKNARSGRTLHETFLPTPTSTEFKREGAAERNGTRGGRRQASEAAKLLPTPTTRPENHVASRSGRDPQTLASAAQKLLPTPWASDATKGARAQPTRPGKEGPTLPEAIGELAARGRLPTPVARDHKGPGLAGQLPTEIARLQQRGLLPTPTAQDARAGGPAGNRTAESERHSGATLTDVAVRGLDVPGRSMTSDLELELSSPPSPTLAAGSGPGPGHLSPSFVEWMMGFPAGWISTASHPPTPTSSTPSATPSSSTPPPTRSSSSGIGSTGDDR
jgi:hypothetical protein